VSITRLGEILVVAGVIVVAAGVGVEVLRFGRVGDFALADVLSLSLEANVPTWYSSMLLFSAALALHAAGTDDARWRAHWWGLALAFAGISLDEVAGFHERLNGLARLGGVLHFAWVIPFAVLVAVVGLLCVPFLRALPSSTRTRFVLAGTLYVGGALGVELVLGAWTDRHGPMNLVYRLIDAVEEAGEIAGVSLFVWAVLAHRATQRATAEPAGSDPVVLKKTSRGPP
jgi:hypothetical protein